MAHSRPQVRPKSSRATSQPAERASRYTARDGAIIGRNVGRCFNRPLYVANTNAFVLAGDHPVVRFASGDTVHGTLRMGLVRGGRTRWLHEAGDITTEFRPAHVRWTVHDGALTVVFEVVALADEVGFAAKAQITGAKPGDRLAWSYGGAKTWAEKNLNWELDPHREPKLMPEIFENAWCAGNVAQANEADGTFSLAPSDEATAPRTAGRCVATGATLEIKANEGEPKEPVISGFVRFSEKHPAEVCWSFKRIAAGETETAGAAADPVERFAAGLARSAALAARLVVETPEPRLDAAAGMLAAALDGVWYPPVYRHGAMLWNSRYPGWRTVFGGTALGWHNRVKAQAKFYTASQVTSAENTSMEADPKLLLTMPAANARFYGRGRIKEDQSVYNMQSQFFDQLIHAWRWTGDAELEAVLRPALELHLEWLRDCFGRDGLYESYINTWPTDSVWFAGGGATEETSYAYRAHGAARELALRAGDQAAAQRHGQTLVRIRAAFQRKLWIREKGHAGLYREQEGLQRLHDDPWLYSLFLPVDAGLVDAEQAAESLRYAETGLQNDRMPCGGRQVWTSNFVPGIWSVRELWPGDNCHLALAYFQAGLGEDAWEVLRGTLLHTAFDFNVPGDFGAPPGGTDFGDSTHMFARTLVEGLFGYAPERSRGVVRLAPQFPADWDRARLRTPEVSLAFARQGPTLTLDVELTEAAKVEIRLPVCARGVKGITVDGRPVRWTAEAGFGRTWVRVARPKTARITLVVTLSGVVATAAGVFGPVAVSGKVGERLTLRPAKGLRLQALSDPQGVLRGAKVSAGAITGQVAGTAGAHTVFARGKFGSLPQLTRFQVQVADPAAERAAAAKLPGPVPSGTRAKWRCVDLAAALNGDIRTIYQQKYLSPRPATISARIGIDGYTPWTFNYWSSYPPVIQLDGVPALLAKSGADGVTCLQTPQGVPFAWPGEARNVAFTSRWDNWPDQVTVPVGCAGDAVWFLICGSTNPMQGRIANAVLRLRYSDHSAEETLELVPPVNYWNLSPIRPVITAPGQESRFDYVSPVDRYCLPKVLPQTVQLGENCRAMLLGRRLRPGAVLREVTLETLSAEVVVGLMGLTVMGAR